jgi:hypothetical protein
MDVSRRTAGEGKGSPEPPIIGGNSEYFDSVVSNGVFVGFVTVVCSPHF